MGSEIIFSSLLLSFVDDMVGMGALIDRISSTGSNEVADAGTLIS